MELGHWPINKRGPDIDAVLAKLDSLAGPSTSDHATSWLQDNSALFTVPSDVDLRADLHERPSIVPSSAALLIKTGAVFMIGPNCQTTGLSATNVISPVRMRRVLRMLGLGLTPDVDELAHLAGYQARQEWLSWMLTS